MWQGVKNIEKVKGNCSEELVKSAKEPFGNGNAGTCGCVQPILLWR